ncbi:MAG: sulfatase [Opitutales bacterium]
MAAPQTHPSGKRRPNILWVFGDQHRAQATGYRGDPNVRTPHLDALSRFGVRFDNAVAGAPWCVPFRGALLTGRYPHRVGAVSTPARLDPAHYPTIAQPFKDAGYHTAYIGKWHLGGSNAEHIIPENERGGFDYWMGFETGNQPYNCPIHGTDAPELTRLPGYQTDALTDLTLRHLRAHVGEAGSDYDPFFTVLSVQPPHDPYVAPGCDHRHNPATLQLRPNVPEVSRVQARARADLAGYYAMIENLDRNLGRLLEGLRKLGVDRDTWIFFFSDHGDCHGAHGLFRKSNPFEESIRIPLVIAKASPEAGSWHHISRSVVNHIDLAPTALGLCGLEAPAAFVGHNYASEIAPDALQPVAEAPDSAYLQQIVPKLHTAGLDTAWRGIVTRDGWKYVCTPAMRWLLFNLNEDPYEQVNLALMSEFTVERERLHAQLADWIARTGDDFSLPTTGPIT